MLLKLNNFEFTGRTGKSAYNYPAKHPQGGILKQLDKDTLSLSIHNNASTPKTSFLKALTKNSALTFLGFQSDMASRPVKMVNKEEISSLASRFTDELLLINPEEITCKKVLELVNKFLPDNQVKVYELNETNNKGLENAYAYYKSSISGEKAFYINCNVDCTEQIERARLIRGIIHEFTHALQDNNLESNKNLNTLIIQRGMLKTFNNLFFSLEDDLYKYFNFAKHHTAKKEIDQPSTTELLKLFNNTRAQQDNDYKDLLFPVLVNRLCVDKPLASEFFIKELKDEAQAYKLGQVAYNKALDKTGIFYNYDQFYVLFEDLAHYLESKEGYAPKFPDSKPSTLSEIDKMALDLERIFGQSTIIKNFDRLSTLKVSDISKDGQLHLFDFYTEFNRESLSAFYDDIIHQTLSKYSVIPDKQVMKNLHEKISDAATKVKRHLHNLKLTIGAEKELFVADFITLLYEDFANHLANTKK